jgi:hypothetical protein
MMKVIVTLIAYQDWVWSHPNRALVGNYYISGGNVYAGERRIVSQLVQKGWHTDPSPTEIDWIGVTEPPKAAEPIAGKPAHIGGRQAYMPADVNVVIDQRRGKILNVNRKLVEYSPGGGKNAFAVTLTQGSDGRWRIIDIHKLNPPGGLAGLAR